MRRLVVTAVLAALMSSVLLAVGAPAHADLGPETRVKNVTFYPTVRDGYKDRVEVYVNRLSGETELFKELQAEVVQVSTGRTVRKISPRLFVRPDGWTDDTLHWNGRNNRGRFVKPGQYRLKITALEHDPDTGTYAPAETSYLVELRKGVFPRDFDRRVAGTRTSSRRIGEGCYAREERRTLEVGCDEGTRATVTWTFTVPEKAYAVGAYVWGDERTRGPGRIHYTRTRVSSTRFVVSVEVSKSRSRTVEAIELHWKARTRL